MAARRTRCVLRQVKDAISDSKLCTSMHFSSLRQTTSVLPYAALARPRTHLLAGPHTSYLGPALLVPADRRYLRTRPSLRFLRHLERINAPSVSKWIGRGRKMRRRLGAWAESVGLTQASEPVLGPNGQPIVGEEELFVLPGWAVLKPKADGPVAIGPLDLHVSISGFCSQSRPPKQVTRTQRVMLSAVRRFAALPNITDPEHQPMGPLPTAVGVAMAEEADESWSGGQGEPLKEYATYKSKRQRAAAAVSQGSAPGSSAASIRAPPSRQSSVSSTDTAFVGKEAVETAHQNLEARLAPFWSSILPNRRVLFDVYPPSRETDSDPKDVSQTIPLVSFQVVTDDNGHFSKTIVVPGDKLQQAIPEAKDSDVGQPTWKLRVRARLDYEVLPVSEDDRSYRERLRRATSSYGVNASDAPTARSAVDKPDAVSLYTPGEPKIVRWATIKVGRADGIHVISDLDDTVKHSDILAGPREVFRNVFCRPIEHICVPEMNAMYRRLDDRGVAGFHFVSNSPSQLFPSIRLFLSTHEFPDRHSLKLKYYGSRNIFSSLYESPAERKRDSMRELFESFPRAKFVLFGDSAEQDLELYLESAKAYPDRVAAIAIRDVTSDRAADVWQAPEEPGAFDSLAKQLLPSLTTAGEAPPTAPTMRSVPGGGRPAGVQRTNSQDSVMTEEGLDSLSSAQQKIVRRAMTWQTRMAKARAEVPPGTEVFFFKEPSDVEGEINRIVDADAAGART